MRNLFVSLIRGVFLNVVIASMAFAEGTAASACKTCKCKDEDSGFKVDCASRNLKAVPENIPTNVTVLILSRNKISELKVDDFSSATILTELHVKNNTVTQLHPDLFAHNLELTFISLSENRLKEMPDTLLHHVQNLTRLRLEKNDIQYLPPELFKHSRHIREIFLSSNSIRELPEGIFNNTSELERMYINNNLLESLSPDLFANTPSLQIASFSNNSIQEIPADLFYSTPAIKKMDFSWNKITKFHESTLSKATKLFFLFLDSNSLTSLSESVFAFTNNLLQLHLCFNNFSSLPPNLFSNTSQLNTLHLESNTIARLPSGLFRNTPELISINLSSNHLTDIPGNLLAKTKDLRSLHVAANRLRRLPVKLFSATPELNNISFSSNFLESVPEGFFSSTPKLKMIDFVHNRLTDLHGNLFAAVKELKYIQMSANRIDAFSKDLFRNVVLTDEMDFSNNSIRSIPPGLFSSNNKSHTLKTLFLQRNNISYIQRGAFSGLGQLLLICLFDNHIKAIGSGAFSIVSLRKIFLFKNDLQQITNSSFANSNLSEIHLYGNNISDITNDATKGISSRPTWFLSCELLQNVDASNILIKCINEKFAPKLKVDEIVSGRLTAEGFTCEKDEKEKSYQICKLCKPGTYSLGDNICYPCPMGGFYQDTIGVKSSSSTEIGCKRCNNGTFVNFTGGASAQNCEVCPEGTNKGMPAGFRACICKDGYARTHRFGPCYRCNQTGLNCSGHQDYQSIMKGYYWYWNFTGADIEEYGKFVRNLLEESNASDVNCFYSKQIPRVHRCPRPESCNTNQTGDAPVRGSCSQGYTGWLCNKCYRGYFSLLQKCIECPPTMVLVGETFFTTALAVTICYLIWTQYAKHKKRNTDERNLLDIIVSRFKISLGFYQVLGEFFSSIKDVRWIGMFDFMGEILSYLRLNVLRIFFRPQCFDESLYINPKVEFIIALCIIFSLTVVPVLLYHIMKVYFRFTHGSVNIQPKVKLLKAKIFTVSLVLLFVTYPPICTAIFQIYHRACVEFCADLNNQSCRVVLRSDFELQCKDLRVDRGLAYVATITYIVAFPVAVYYLLRKYCAPKMTATLVDSGTVNDNAAPLLSIECDQMNIPVGLKFLCENYKPQFWYWEIVELTRKVTQTALLTLLGWDDKLTVLLTIGVSVLFLTLHARYRPMKSVLEQRLQMFSLTAILINVLVSAMAMTVPDKFEQRLAVIILLLNISVIVILLIEAALGVIVQMKRLQFYRRIYDPRRFQKSISIISEDTDEEE